jgi:hypothetical protein
VHHRPLVDQFQLANSTGYHYPRPQYQVPFEGVKFNSRTFEAQPAKLEFNFPNGRKNDEFQSLRRTAEYETTLQPQID